MKRSLLATGRRYGAQCTPEHQAEADKFAAYFRQPFNVAFWAGDFLGSGRQHTDIDPAEARLPCTSMSVEYKFGGSRWLAQLAGDERILIAGFLGSVEAPRRPLAYYGAVKIELQTAVKADLWTCDMSPAFSAWRDFYMKTHGKDIKPQYSAMLYMMVDLVTFLHTENVLLAPVDRRIAKRKRWQRKKRGLTWHTIYIVPGKAQRKIEPAPPAGSQRLLAAHLRRGHFKTYGQNGRGKLFGKYSGRFWWGPRLVGNVKVGFSGHDYGIDHEQKGA